MSNDEHFSGPQDRLGRIIASCDIADWFVDFYGDQGRLNGGIGDRSAYYTLDRDRPDAIFY